MWEANFTYVCARSIQYAHMRTEQVSSTWGGESRAGACTTHVTPLWSRPQALLGWGLLVAHVYSLLSFLATPILPATHPHASTPSSTARSGYSASYRGTKSRTRAAAPCPSFKDPEGGFKTRFFSTWVLKPGPVITQPPIHLLWVRLCGKPLLAHPLFFPLDIENNFLHSSLGSTR